MNTCECDQCVALREENERLREQVEIAVKALQDIDKLSYNCTMDTMLNTISIIAMDALISLGEAHSGA